MDGAYNYYITDSESFLELTSISGVLNRPDPELRNAGVNNGRSSRILIFGDNKILTMCVGVRTRTVSRNNWTPMSVRV